MLSQTVAADYSVAFDMGLNIRDHFLVRLYREARAAPPGQFQELILSALREKVGFESAFWGNGRVFPDMLGVVLTAGQTLNLNPEFLREWSEVVHEDRAIPVVLAELGRLVQIDVCKFYFYSPLCIALASRFNLHHLALVAAPGLLDGEIQWISLFANAASGPFSPAKRRWLEFIFPHMCEAWRLHQSVAQVPCHPAETRGARAGIIDSKNGRILSAEPGFKDWLSKAWGKFNGQTIPESIQRKILSEGTFSFARLNFSLSAYAIRGLTLIYIEEHKTASLITERQRQIAALFANGMTHKEVANACSLAPATVRNHLAHVYIALNVTCRRGLAQRLALLAPDRRDVT